MKIEQDEHGISCPICGKKFNEERYNFDYHPKGWRGKCPGCKGKVVRTQQAAGLVRNASGQLVRSSGRRKK